MGLLQMKVSGRGYGSELYFNLGAENPPSILKQVQHKKRGDRGMFIRIAKTNEHPSVSLRRPLEDYSHYYYIKNTPRHCVTVRFGCEWIEQSATYIH